MKHFLIVILSFLYIYSGVNAQAYKTQPVKLKASVYEKAVPSDTNKVQTAEPKISGHELVLLIKSAQENFKGAKVLYYNDHRDTSAMYTEDYGYVIFIPRNKNVPDGLIINIMDSPYVYYDFNPKKWAKDDPLKGYK